MKDERLEYIVEHWDEFSWFDRKLIWFRSLKYKYRINAKELISLATLISIVGVLILENHPNHKTGLLAIIVLLYFYILFINYLMNRGKIV